jgi:hypothetical protein
MKSHIITRKTSQRHVREAVAAADARHRRQEDALIRAAQIERARMIAEWDHKSIPILRRMVDVTAQPNVEAGSYTLHVAIDRLMLEQAAMTNDEIAWRHIAEMVGRHVQRELATMNFAGLSKMADDFERRYRRPSFAPPGSVMDAFK